MIKSIRKLAARYTVKAYQSEKAVSEEGSWRYVQFSLMPINPDFKPIE